jgi:type III restriction enzyme
MSKKKAKRAARPIVAGHLEKISSRIFDQNRSLITEMIKGRYGVYALYRREKLYYVGLATNLRSRINQHLKDRHKGKWTHFSLYILRKTDHLREIRRGFRGEGLGDLMGRVAMKDETEQMEQAEVTAQIRDKFKSVAEQVILPVFAIRDGSGWRKVSYEMDIASQIPWDEVDLSPLYSLTLSMMDEKDLEQVASLSNDAKQVIELKDKLETKTGSLRLDPVFVARHLLDIVPNAWVAHEFGTSVLQKLLRQNEEKVVVNNFVFIIEELRKHLSAEKDRLAEQVFRRMISEDKLRFLVIANKLGYKLTKPKKATAPYLTKKTAAPLERSLFDPVTADDFNETEKKVAWYLDDQDKLFFWYRNVPKSDYGVQGWQKHRVYADFIFTDSKSSGNGFNRVFVVETKGIHLKGSEDTNYKTRLFNLCNELAQETTLTELGVKLQAKDIWFFVIAEDEWQRRLNELFAEV